MFDPTKLDHFYRWGFLDNAVFVVLLVKIIPLSINPPIALLINVLVAVKCLSLFFPKTKDTEFIRIKNVKTANPHVGEESKRIVDSFLEMINQVIVSF